MLKARWSRRVLSNYTINTINTIISAAEESETSQKLEIACVEPCRSKRIACKGRHAYTGKHALNRCSAVCSREGGRVKYLGGQNPKMIKIEEIKEKN